VRNLFTEVTPSRGLNGNNLIKARGGNDQLQGGARQRHLYGGEGRDELAGGADNDVFVFDSPLKHANRDIITDFAKGRILSTLTAKFSPGFHRGR
jgi:Ca2+-binding RTX toxin-like protein